MKLVEFSIANLGSIRSLDFSDLGSKMVILGPNGTGKSFVIQGLELLLMSSRGNLATLQTAT